MTEPLSRFFIDCTSATEHAIRTRLDALEHKGFNVRAVDRLDLPDHNCLLVARGSKTGELYVRRRNWLPRDGLDPIVSLHRHATIRKLTKQLLEENTNVPLEKFNGQHKFYINMKGWADYERAAALAIVESTGFDPPQEKDAQWYRVHDYHGIEGMDEMLKPEDNQTVVDTFDAHQIWSLADMIKRPIYHVGDHTFEFSEHGVELCDGQVVNPETVYSIAHRMARMRKEAVRLGYGYQDIKVNTS